METGKRTKRSSFCSQAQRTSAGAKLAPTTLNSVTAKRLTDQTTEQEDVVTSLSVSKPYSLAHPYLQETNHCLVSVTREENLVRRNTLDDDRPSSRQSFSSTSTFDPKDIHPVRLQRNIQRGSQKCDDAASRPRSRKIFSTLLGQPPPLNAAPASAQQPENEV